MSDPVSPPVTDSPDLMSDKICVLMSCSGHGGVERMVVNLIHGLAKRVKHIDLLLLKDRSPHLSSLPQNVRRIKLKTDHSALAVGEIADYLLKENPKAMLVAKDRAGRAALKAREKARKKASKKQPLQTRICIRLGTNLSAALKKKNAFNRWLRAAPMKRLYPLADCVIAVSEGVRQDTLAITGINAAQTNVIRNPVITPRLVAEAQEPVPHPWLENKTVPVLMGAGRLSDQKDFATLIAAFAEVKKQRDCRLMILGEGGLRAELTEQIAELGLNDHVLMPGFQKNLYAWLSRADLFVLSSRWEGSPNVLSEALALGIPSVSTRCPSGPDEVLQEGKFGPLVEMVNVSQMADAMLSVLQNPLPSETLREAVNEYRVEVSTGHYLRALLANTVE